MASPLKPLQTIFTNRIFRIPDYQRGYAWGARQLDDFWHDLWFLPEGHTHYTGVLTIEQAPKPKWKDWVEDQWLLTSKQCTPFYVVDGQQRLTTAVILVKCILDRVPKGKPFEFATREDIEKQYVRRSLGVNQSFLFGYEKDNPSYEFLKTRIFGAKSNSNQGVMTLYTANLEAAKAFFEAKLKKLSWKELEKVFSRVTCSLLFNEYEIEDDLDVFVAFETMNNRGKPLSKLELLKNRLIYLSTLVPVEEGEREALRTNINEAWKTIYECLGREKGSPLDDDEFLRNHWILYFGYSRDKAGEFSNELLDKHFTARRATAGKLTAKEIQEYITSIQESARQWYALHFPGSATGLEDKVRRGLERLCRLGRGAFAPLILAALVKKADRGQMVAVLREAERFIFLVSRVSRRRADTGDSHFFSRASDYYWDEASLGDVTKEVAAWTDQYYSVDQFRLHVQESFDQPHRQGFYDWSGLRYFLFEYEQHLQSQKKSATTKINWDEFNEAKRDHVTIEHIYPQSAESASWTKRFGKLNWSQQRQVLHGLGNLLALSQHKNVQVSNAPFAEKKKPTSGKAGYNFGSYSELEVAAETDWTPISILDRGLKLFDFLEERWGVELGDEAEKARLLQLDWLLEKRAKFQRS